MRGNSASKNVYVAVCVVLNVLFVELFMCSREDTVYLAESLLCVSGALGPSSLLQWHKRRFDVQRPSTSSSMRESHVPKNTSYSHIRSYLSSLKRFCLKNELNKWRSEGALLVGTSSCVCVCVRVCARVCVQHLKDKGCSIPLYVDGFWLLQISLLIRISNRGEQQQPAAITKTQTSPYRDLKEQISK